MRVIIVAFSSNEIATLSTTKNNRDNYHCVYFGVDIIEQHLPYRYASFQYGTHRADA